MSKLQLWIPPFLGDLLSLFFCLHSQNIDFAHSGDFSPFSCLQGRSISSKWLNLKHLHAEQGHQQHIEGRRAKPPVSKIDFTGRTKETCFRALSVKDITHTQFWTILLTIPTRSWCIWEVFSHVCWIVLQRSFWNRYRSVGVHILNSLQMFFW